MQRLRLFFIFFVVATSGCGTENRQKHSAVQESGDAEFQRALKSQPASQSISITAVSEADCALDSANTPEEVTPVLVLEQQNSELFWNQCRSLFACSPHASAALTNMATHARSFRISFVNFSSLSGNAPFDDIRGLYLTGEDRVYLQNDAISGISSLSQNCGVLLHELFHLDDRMDQGQAIDLSAEFPAHYLERWFNIEIVDRVALSSSESAATQVVTRHYLQGASGPEFLTRTSLAQAITRLYHFTITASDLQSYVNGFAPFPAEALAGN